MRVFPLLSLLTVAALLPACGSSQPGNAVSPADAGATSDATDAVDDANATADAANEFACSAPDASLSIARAPVSIDPPRDHHHTLVRETPAGSFLYVIGGGKDSFAQVFDDVQRSKLGDDGSLGAFETVSHVPGGIAGAALGVIGNTILLAGGTPTNPHLLNTTKIGTFADDGSVGAWSDGPTLPQSLMHAVAVVDGKHYYVFGGTTGAAASKMSVMATLGDDGKLSAYTNVTPLDTPLSHAAGFVFGRSIYLAGGLSADPNGSPPSLASVVRAEIQPDGTLGPWLPAGTLPITLSVSAAQQFGCSIFMFGGLSDAPGGTPFTDVVLKGTVGEDGTFTAVVTSAKLSTKRGHVHQTPIYRNFIYSVAGRSGEQLTSIGTIDIGTFALPN